MLLFSTLLNIKPTLTKQDFIDLVFEWNRTSTYEENIIPNLVWNGEQNIRYGNNKVWLHILDSFMYPFMSFRLNMSKSTDTRAISSSSSTSGKTVFVKTVLVFIVFVTV